MKWSWITLSESLELFCKMSYQRLFCNYLKVMPPFVFKDLSQLMQLKLKIESRRLILASFKLQPLNLKDDFCKACNANAKHPWQISSNSSDFGEKNAREDIKSGEKCHHWTGNVFDHVLLKHWQCGNKSNGDFESLQSKFEIVRDTWYTCLLLSWKCCNIRL